MQYYVYVYLDTRKSGNYVFENYHFEFEPIYIGKGKEDRWESHLKNYYKANPFLKRKINKIVDETNEIPLILKVKDNLNEEEAFILEKQLIKLIGRKDLKLGSLCNLTDGGEGLINCSEKTKNKLRKPFTEERKQNISKGKKGKLPNSTCIEVLKFFREIPVVYLDSNLNILKEYSTIKEACNELNITNSSTHRFCNYYYNMRNGNTLRYKNDLIGQKIYIKNNENDKTKKFLQSARKTR